MSAEKFVLTQVETGLPFGSYLSIIFAFTFSLRSCTNSTSSNPKTIISITSKGNGCLWRNNVEAYQENITFQMFF